MKSKRMEFFSALYKGEEIFGLATDEKTINLKAAIKEIYDREIRNLSEFIEDYASFDIDVLLKRAEAIENFKSLELLAPISRPRRNPICVGKNYKEHVNEVKGLGPIIDIPKTPIYFSKLVDSTTGHGQDFIVDQDKADALDYEAELVIVIGKTCKNIKAKDARAHIFGFTCGNDFSQRRLQKLHDQWLMGKSLDGACAIGPSILKCDDFDYNNLNIRSYVNGQLRQENSTSNMIFPIEKLIENLSSILTLVPGDLIFTGTPAGVGAGFNPPKYLKNGDIVEVEIGNLGILKNRVVVRP